MEPRPFLKRWTHRRVLMAAGLAALGACAILWFTRKGDEAPYTPGAAVEGITDVLKKDVSSAGWGVVFRDVAGGRGIDFRHFSAGPRSTQLPEDMGSGCAFADYDGDGDWDLFVVDTIGPLTLTPDEVRAAKGGCRLYRNDGGTFTDVTAEAGLSDLKGTYMGAAWGDFDNDGYPDLVVTSLGGIRLFHNRGDGTFEEIRVGTISNEADESYVGSWGDYDGDGYLDLFVANGSAAGSRKNDFLYRNNHREHFAQMGKTNHWLRINLRGTASNRSGIGAKVFVTARIGGKIFTQLRQIGGQTCAPELFAHFGLGDARQATTLRVEWPSGTVQPLSAVPADQTLTLWEPPFLRAAVLADGSCELTVTAEPNRPWQIEASTDLSDWQLLATVTNSTPMFRHTDAAAGGLTCRFYRVGAVP